MLEIEHNSSVPLHVQVEHLLRDLARKPEYQDGALLPNETALARKLGISRGTIRAGISKLVFEGLLQRKAGVGTRVATNKHLESGITAWRSFTREMASKGITVENYVQDYCLTRVLGEVANALQITTEVEIWRLDRVRGWGNQPVLNSTSWFHPRLGLKGTEDFSRPLYEELEATTGVKPHHVVEEFMAVSADATKARLLQVPRTTPLLLRRHLVFDAGNRPIEFAEVYYVSSRFTLSLVLNRAD